VTSARRDAGALPSTCSSCHGSLELRHNVAPCTPALRASAPVDAPPRGNSRWS
jgi:hypothetical protein